MEIKASASREYQEIFPNSYHRFNEADFNLLNEGFCDRLFFLLFRDSKTRLGLIVGAKAGELYTPFSAPFGGFSFTREDISLANLESGVDALCSWAVDNGFLAIHYTMPPLFYQELFCNKVLSVLSRKGFVQTAIDMNFQFDLGKLTDDYEMSIWHNARKNLRISLKQGFEFIKCESAELKLAAYEVIKENRSRKGYPLKMTYEQVMKTTEVIKADFFLVKRENQPVAAAQIFHVAVGIAQVIYWGDIPDYAPLKPMNFLAFQVFGYYKKMKYRFVDIGPSTENGLPNYGLCEFKESIGCGISPKFSFIKSFQ